VKIDLRETSREFRQATFVLYNCARLAKLFQNFEENVHKGEINTSYKIIVIQFQSLKIPVSLQYTQSFYLTDVNLSEFEPICISQTFNNNNFSIHVSRLNGRG